MGYAIARSLDARIAVAALERAIALRRPLPGCVFHGDRGSQDASEKHRALLRAHGFVGSMSRRGNPYGNPQAESFMKTLKVEAVYLAEHQTYADIAADIPRFIDEVRRLHSALGYLSPPSSRTATPAPRSNRRSICPTAGAHSNPGPDLRAD